MGSTDDPERARKDRLERSATPSGRPDSFEQERAAMVTTQLVPRGISDPRVLDAMRAVPRHRFVPRIWRPHAYEDRALPIEAGQTISQPYIVALMTQALTSEPGHHTLEVGTGSGYQTAILAWLGHTVVTIERFDELRAGAERTLHDLGLATGVTFLVGDGSTGPPEAAPGAFSRILIAAGAPELPAPLARLLAPGGRLVVPIGDGSKQELRLFRRAEDGSLHESRLCECSFVPLVGREGWPET